MVSRLFTLFYFSEQISCDIGGWWTIDHWQKLLIPFRAVQYLWYKFVCMWVWWVCILTLDQQIKYEIKDESTWSNCSEGGRGRIGAISTPNWICKLLHRRILAKLDKWVRCREWLTHHSRRLYGLMILIKIKATKCSPINSNAFGDRPTKPISDMDLPSFSAKTSSLPDRCEFPSSLIE